MLSKLQLGTVSFGIDGYSLPSSGKPKPSESKVFEILDYATNNGIGLIDTASAYGNVEDVIGKYPGAANFDITSKLMPNCIDSLLDEDIQAYITRQLHRDLLRLNHSKILGYYFHSERYIYCTAAVAAMKECKREKLVDLVGVSIYEPENAISAAKMKFDIIQVPYNILDQRLHKTDFFNIAKANGVVVFGRSPFLKGLLSLPIESIPKHLGKSSEYIKSIDETAAKYGLSRIELALLFSLAADELDYVVFGVDNIGQLKQDLEVYKNLDKYDLTCIEELRHLFSRIEDYVVIPSLWKK